MNQYLFETSKTPTTYLKERLPYIFVKYTM